MEFALDDVLLAAVSSAQGSRSSSTLTLVSKLLTSPPSTHPPLNSLYMMINLL